MEYGHREPPPKFQFLESCVRNGISRASISQEPKTLHKEGGGADADGPIGKPESTHEKQQGGIAVNEADLNFTGNMSAAGYSGPSSRPCSIPV